MVAKSKRSILAAATIVALTLTGLGVSAIAATSAKNTAATGYVVCVSKGNGDMKLRTKSTCPRGFTTKIFGAKGPAGVAGAQGEAGPAGAQGAAGVDGAQGLKGEIGEQGAQGPEGLPGLDGQQGLQGEQGNSGQNGVSQAYYNSGWHVPLNAPGGVTTLTSLTLPAGNYLVSASSTFESDGTPNVNTFLACWVEVGGAIQLSGETQLLAPITMTQPVYLNQTTTLDFICAGDYSIESIGAKAPSLSAIKVDQVNPQG